MKTLFVDTNLFLQCIDISQINWKELNIKENITLIISSPVQEEIDRFKSDGNQRRAKKARKANTYLKTIILSEAEEKIINESSPRVILKFSPIISLKIECDILDLNRADDRILFEALNYKESVCKETAILTHDTNPLLTARRIGLEFFVIPDSWLLNTENSKNEKEFARLERRIASLEKNKPNLKIECKQNKKNIKEIEFTVNFFEKLQPHEINEIIVLLKDKYPLLSKEELMKTRDTENTTVDIMCFQDNRKFIKPSEDSIDKYIREDYPNWVKKTEEFLTNSHNTYVINSFVEINFFLSNSGNVPAESILVEIETYSGIELLPKDCSVENTYLDLPTPPKKPESHYIDNFRPIFPHSNNGLLDNITYPVNRQNSDKNSFYWKNRRPEYLTTKYEYTCEEFRHQLEVEQFQAVLNYTNKNQIKKSNLRMRVSCNNLPNPVIENVPVKIIYVSSNLYSFTTLYRDY